METVELDNKPHALFFELLSVLTGARDSLNGPYEEKDWEDALVIANNQSVTGVLLDAIEKLPKDQAPPQMVILNWFGTTRIIESNTRLVDDCSKKAIDFFRNNGFPCHILKGVSVGRYYPNPIHRSSGDLRSVSIKMENCMA